MDFCFPDILLGIVSIDRVTLMSQHVMFVAALQSEGYRDLISRESGLT
jgi:hypothetical protein